MNVRTLLSIALALTGACAADASLDEAAFEEGIVGEGDGSGTSALEAPVDEEAGAERVTLARLSLEDGHEIVFELDPEGDEVSVSESAPLELESAVPLLWNEGLADLDALALYLELTPEDRPVPDALVDLAADRDALDRLGSRELVDHVDLAPVRATLPKVNTSQDSGYMPELCGSNGQAEFQAICNTSRGGVALSYCSPGKGTWHQRTTNGKYRESRGFAVSCRASVRTRHGRKIGGWYYETFDMNASSYWHYTRVWNNSLKYRRQVRMDRYLPTSTSTSESYIRSWIGFKS